ncbi:MAG: hypothetical protein ABJB55_05790 [Actinomycetota bacterium]
MGALTALVIVETIVLALLAVVVVSLLRSHAEVLRRLPAPDDEPEHHAHGAAVPIERAPTLSSSLPAPTRRATEAHDVVGATLGGDQVVVSAASGSDTLFAFLSTGCLTCQGFWDGLQPGVRQPLPGGARVVVVVKDPAFESPSKLTNLAPPDVPVIYSSAAWEDFGVQMSPYFCFVDGRSGTVRSEGAAMSWDQVSSLLSDALLDEAAARAKGIG